MLVLFLIVYTLPKFVRYQNYTMVTALVLLHVCNAASLPTSNPTTSPTRLPDDLCQVGDPFVGGTNAELGRAVDISNEGNTIVISEKYGTLGKLKVLEFENDSWVQRGDAFVGGQNYDFCGNSLSLSKNGSIVAFGCESSSYNGAYSGHAEVWQFNDNTWVQLGQKITGDPSSYNGNAISLSNDGKVIAIGALYDDSNANNAGLARVYRYENGAWAQRGQDLFGEHAGHKFGHDLSLSSDGTILAVGAPYHPDSSSHGHVRVFQYGNTNNTWIQLGLDIEGTNQWDQFGYAVSLSGDGATIAIGEIRKDGINNIQNTGAVYVYEFSNGNWELKGDIIHGLYVSGLFGHPVSLSKDGQTVVSMGADGDFNGTDSGHVMVHRYINGEWVQIGKSIGGNTNGGSDGQVAISGNRIIVGFPESTGTNNGEVDVYEFCNSLSPTTGPTTSPTLNPTTNPTLTPTTNPTSSPTTSPTLNPTSPTTSPVPNPTTSPTPLPDDMCQVGDSFVGEASDLLGKAVDISNEGNTIVISEHENTKGKVKVFEFENDAWVQRGDAFVGVQANDRCGESVSLSKNGSILAFGCIGSDYNGTYSGHAEVWFFNGNTWVQLGQRITGYPSSYSGIKISLSDDGTVIAIGASYDDGNGNNAGRARVFRYEDGAWSQRGQDLFGEDEGDRFGHDLSLSSDGTILAVGAPYHPDGATHGHARVFRYENTNNTWNLLGLDIEGSNENDQFGYAVSLSGDGATIAIGERYKQDDSNNIVNTGAVYVYEFSNGNWELKGDIIHGLYVGGRFGHTVDLSKDGQTVASIEDGGDFNGTDSGHVMLHRYVNGEWVQIGKSIGGNTGGGSGGQIAMSSNRIIVGFPRSTGSFFTSNGEVDVYELCHEPTTSPTNEPPRSPEDDDGGSDEGLGIIIGASVGGVVVVGGVGLYFYMTRGAASVARLTRINLGELIF